MNSYCQRLTIPTPDAGKVWEEKRPKHLHMMVVCLLERGEPLFLEDIAARLAEVGVPAGRTGDLKKTLQKSWHGLEPIRKRADGRLELDLQAHSLRHLIWSLELSEAPRFVAPEEEPVEPFELPGPEVRLTHAELDAAFRDRALSAVSQLRLAGAVLDAEGKPLSLDTINDRLDRFSRHRGRIRPETVTAWGGRLVEKRSDGLLALDPSSSVLGPMREDVRRMAKSVLMRRHRSEVAKARCAQLEALRSERERLEREQATKMRRAIVRAVPEPFDLVGLAVCDVASREIEVFVGVETADATPLLLEYDLIAGEYVSDTLDALGVETNALTLTDLRPPKKTRVLNKRGRKLRITTEMLVRYTTGISKPFGEKRELEQLIAVGDRTGLEKRLVRDVKALYAYYRYGILHNCVRLRWGFLDETLGVDWALPGDVAFWSLMRICHQRKRAVDVVTGNAPGWRNPWSRARRATVIAVDKYDYVLVDENGEMLDRYDVQAARVVEGEDMPL